MDQHHYVMCKLKELAHELGRVPMISDFQAIFPRIPVSLLFGTWDNALKAAGLWVEEKEEPKKKNPFPPIDDPEKIREVIQSKEMRNVEAEPCREDPGHR
jgi:hypothetical protein